MALERAAQTDVAENKTAYKHQPKFSMLHPMIPRVYVPEWKTDMENRTRILQNAKLAGIYAVPHDESLFLDKRERLNHGEKRDYVNHKVQPQARKVLLRPHFHSHMSRYQSELMYRKDPWAE